MKVSTCVMTHVPRLISEISIDSLSVLVVYILLLSSEDTVKWMTKAGRISEHGVSFHREDGVHGLAARLCFIFISFSLFF